MSETTRVAMMWPVEVKEAVREHVGGRGLTQFVIEAVKSKLDTRPDQMATRKELNETRDLAQRMVDAIVRFGPEEDTLSVIQELELPVWIDTTGWPQEYVAAVARDEPIAEVVNEPEPEPEPEPVAEPDDEDLHRPMFMTRPRPPEVEREVTTPEGVSSSFLERVRAKAAEKGVEIDPSVLKPASQVAVPEKPAQPTRHNHAFERVDGVLCCNCGAWLDDSTTPETLREADWEPEVTPEPEPVAEVATVSDACPKCGSELVAGECWECM